MKKSVLVLSLMLFTVSVFSGEVEKSGLLVNDNSPFGQRLMIVVVAGICAVATHEAGHVFMAEIQGGEVESIKLFTDWKLGEVTASNISDKYLFSIGGVTATQVGYYFTRDSDNYFIKSYSEICRADLFYQTVKGIVPTSESTDLSDNRWIPFAVLSAINLYEDRDWEIHPTSITLKW